MLRKSLSCLVAVSIFTATGCQTGGIKDSWSRMTAGLGGRGELSPEFREAQKMLKHPEETMVAMARWKEDNEEYGEAREQYRQILVAYPENIDARLGMARIEMAIGRQQQAEEQLVALSKEHPENAAVSRELARLYSSREEWPKAISVLNAIADRNPDDQPVRYELGVAYARAGQIDTALPHLTFAVGEAAAKYNIGYLLHESGNDAEAVAWFEQALKSHPDERTSQQCRLILTQLKGPEELPVAATRKLAPATIGTPTIQPRVIPGRLVDAAENSENFTASNSLPDEASASSQQQLSQHPQPQLSRQQQPNRGVLQPVSWSSHAQPQAQPEVTQQSATPSGGNGRSSYSMSDMPQWSGPTARPASGASSGMATQETATKPQIEPPAWRARK